MLVIDCLCIPGKIALRWWSWDFNNDKSTLFQVMACCHHWATRHYLNQCWPRSLSPYGVTNEWTLHWGQYTRGSHFADIFKCISCMKLIFLAATKQLYEWYFLSVCPSVRPSVRLSVCPSVTPFWLCSHHRIIMKFSGVITLDQGKVHATGQGQRSKVKVTEVTTQIFVSGL